MANTPITLDQLKSSGYGDWWIYADKLTSPNQGHFVVELPIPKGFGDFEQNELKHIKRDLSILSEHGYETNYLGSRRVGGKFLIGFTVLKKPSSKAQYDMSGHFRDLPKQADPKKPSKTQDAQQRIDKLKAFKARVVEMTRTLYGSDSSASAEQFQYQETWFRKSMSWCQANGFKKSASAISDLLKYLSKEEIDESLQPELANVIVSINADLQAAKRIFGTKMAKSIVIKAKKKGNYSG